MPVRQTALKEQTLSQYKTILMSFYYYHGYSVMVGMQVCLAWMSMQNRYSNIGWSHTLSHSSQKSRFSK